MRTGGAVFDPFTAVCYQENINKDPPATQVHAYKSCVRHTVKGRSQNDVKTLKGNFMGIMFKRIMYQGISKSASNYTEILSLLVHHHGLYYCIFPHLFKILGDFNISNDPLS